MARVHGLARNFVRDASRRHPFTANPGKTWVETNAGATAQVSQRTTIFASLGYQWDTEGDGHAYNGKIGVRMNW